jgi:predicted alpha/beta superfamily hydrolase
VKSLLLLTAIMVQVLLPCVASNIIASSHSITSTVMNEARTYHVYLPPSYHLEKTRRFPVLYVLDGDMHRMKAIAGMLEGLSTETLDTQVHEAIIVAVPSSDNAIRERDLTPTNVNWEFNGTLLERFSDIGKAKQYLTFFNQELIPYIQVHYRVNQQRIVIGESFGGLFAGYVLLEAPHSFTDYLIIDATYLWDNNYLNRTYEARSWQPGSDINTVLFTFANNSAFEEIGEVNYQWGQAFYQNIAGHQRDDFIVEKRYFENETHGTVALLSWYYGLKHILDKKD